MILYQKTVKIDHNPITLTDKPSVKLNQFVVIVNPNGVGVTKALVLRHVLHVIRHAMNVVDVNVKSVEKQPNKVGVNAIAKNI